MREPVRIDVELDKGCCLFPDRIVAGHENHASLHQGRDRIVFIRERSPGGLIICRIGSPQLALDDQCTGLEILAGQSRELILVPHGLSKSVSCAVPWVTETARKSGCLNDHICELSALRIRLSQGPPRSVLSQACLCAAA